MITLQNILAPEPDICGETALYFRARGGAGCSPGGACFLLPPGSWISFDSYFNMFSLDTWARACALQSLAAEITSSGEIALRLLLTRPGQPPETVFETAAGLDPARPLTVDLADWAALEGTLHLEASAPGPAPAEILGARFATRDRPGTLPRLAVSITTFRREAEVRATVARLNRFLDGFAHAGNIHVQVADNGGSAGISPSRHVTPYPNPNLGGAGGFARGLMEAENRGFSHCLFMDDDAAFHMENITRTYALLALAQDPATALAGAMITTSRPWRLWENGAWFDGYCRPLFNGTDLRDPEAVRAMILAAGTPRPAAFYGAWWFFAFPVAAARHYPFPFFVRGDDVNFSLANSFRILTLNGVVSVQPEFFGKESPLTHYLDLRHSLVQHLVLPALQRSAAGAAWIAVRFILRSLLRCQYESAEAQLMAWRDVMQGPGFFDANITMQARRSTLAALTRQEAWQPAAEQPAPPPRRLFSRLPRPLRRTLGWVTLNGHLVPFWSLLGDRLLLDGETAAKGVFGAARATYLDADGSRSFTVSHSKRRFFALAWRTAVQSLQWLRQYQALTREYRGNYPRMTSRAYWQDMLLETAPDKTRDA
jgi:hypothetical protein